MGAVHDITPSGRDAADWYARVQSGAMTDAETALLDDWLEDPEHAAAFAAFHELDAQVQDVAQAVGGEAGARQGGGASRRRVIGAGVLSAVAAGLIAFIAAPALLDVDPKVERWSTSGSEVETVALPDGSQITLNTNTAVEVAYANTERNVRLLQGEAYFDVAADAARPFSVYTDSSEFRVVGTRFTVSSDDVREGDVLQVAEGGVAVLTDNAIVGDVVTSGGRAFVKPGAPVRYETVAPDAIADWRDGVITFSDTTLSDVRGSIQRYLPTDIIFADEAVAETRVTAVFNISEGETFLEGVAIAAGIDLRYDINVKNGRRIAVFEAGK
ncbi:MAG: FecR domain-containing protein [Pseudomonadota bacterium]